MSPAVTTPAAEAVWQELHDRLRRFIARRVRSPQDAEDILQEVMLRIHRHSGEREHADRVASWVYRIAATSIADHYRSRRAPGAGVRRGDGCRRARWRSGRDRVGRAGLGRAPGRVSPLPGAAHRPT